MSPGGNLAVIGPVVTLPQYVVPVATVLGNYSAGPSSARVQFVAWCADARSKIIPFSAPAQNVTVPGDRSHTKGINALALVGATLRIPAACRARPNWSPSRPDGTFFANVGPVGAQHQWRKQLPFWIGKSFIYANRRHNLKLQTKGIPATSQAHHTLPVKFEPKFRGLGLNIHEPKFLRWWCSKVGVRTNHQSNAWKYNRLWENYFARYPKATKTQVLSFRSRIQPMFKYTC